MKNLADAVEKIDAVVQEIKDLGVHVATTCVGSVLRDGTQKMVIGMVLRLEPLEKVPA